MHVLGVNSQHGNVEKLRFFEQYFFVRLHLHQLAVVFNRWLSLSGPAIEFYSGRTCTDRLSEAG